MSKELTVAIIGCGNFAQFFVPLFKAHPTVKKVYVCDLIREKAEDYARRFDVEIIDSFEAALSDPSINCIANFTERHRHGEIVLAALSAGKHVYSAVPMAPTVEECRKITEMVRRTGLTYLMGETCYYYPCAMYCREMYKKGAFGDFTYGASQYYHHIDAISYGKRPMEGGMPPMLYPTHSTSMLLSAVGSFAKKVVCFGYKDKTHDGRFEKGCNYWDNEFSSQYSMMLLDNGGTARITEARSFGWKKPSSYISALYGTKAGYEFSNAQHIFVEKLPTDGEEKVRLTDVSDYVNTEGMVAHKNDADFKDKVANGEWQWSDIAEVQRSEFSRLPVEYNSLPNGHMATHKLLVDDFCTAAAKKEVPILNACAAARYTVPGLVAIESSKAEGTVLDVPDFGTM